MVALVKRPLKTEAEVIAAAAEKFSHLDPEIGSVSHLGELARHLDNLVLGATELPNPEAEAVWRFKRAYGL